jgi:hypothetical protein
MHFERGAAH